MPAAIRRATTPSRHRRRRASSWAVGRDRPRRWGMPGGWLPASPDARWGRPTDYLRQAPATRLGRERRAVGLPGPLGHKLTPAMAIVLGLAGVYVVLSVVLWALQEKITFPAPRAALPDPKQVLGYGEKIELRMKNGTRLVGWYLPPKVVRRPSPSSAALLWFYGNGETIGAIWPTIRDFRPPNAAL